MVNGILPPGVNGLPPLIDPENDEKLLGLKPANILAIPIAMYWAIICCAVFINISAMLFKKSAKTCSALFVPSIISWTPNVTRPAAAVAASPIIGYFSRILSSWTSYSIKGASAAPSSKEAGPVSRTDLPPANFMFLSNGEDTSNPAPADNSARSLASRSCSSARSKPSSSKEACILKVSIISFLRLKSSTTSLTWLILAPKTNPSSCFCIFITSRSLWSSWLILDCIWSCLRSSLKIDCWSRFAFRSSFSFSAAAFLAAAAASRSFSLFRASLSISILLILVKDNSCASKKTKFIFRGSPCASRSLSRIFSASIASKAVTTCSLRRSPLFCAIIISCSARVIELEVFSFIFACMSACTCLAMFRTSCSSAIFCSAAISIFNSFTLLGSPPNAMPLSNLSLSSCSFFISGVEAVCLLASLVVSIWFNVAFTSPNAFINPAALAATAVNAFESSSLNSCVSLPNFSKDSTPSLPTTRARRLVAASKAASSPTTSASFWVNRPKAVFVSPVAWIILEKSPFNGSNAWPSSATLPINASICPPIALPRTWPPIPPTEPNAPPATEPTPPPNKSGKPTPSARFDKPLLPPLPPPARAGWGPIGLLCWVVATALPEETPGIRFDLVTFRPWASSRMPRSSWRFSSLLWASKNRTPLCLSPFNAASILNWLSFNLTELSKIWSPLSRKAGRACWAPATGTPGAPEAINCALCRLALSRLNSLTPEATGPIGWEYCLDICKSKRCCFKNSAVFCLISLLPSCPNSRSALPRFCVISKSFCSWSVIFLLAFKVSFLNLTKSFSASILLRK